MRVPALLACCAALFAARATAQIDFFVPNATIDASPAEFISGVAHDGRTALVAKFSGAPMVSVYKRHGPLGWDLEATLHPPLGFGGNLAVEGNLAVVTGLTDGGPNLPAIVAFVYQRLDHTWQLTHTLTVPTEHGPGFGNSVDIEGDTIVISSYSGGGAVFIYRRTASGDVVLQQEIDTEAGEQAAALDKKTLLVSAPDARLLPGFPYRVVVYQLTPEGAVPVQTLLPSDPIRGETFGDALAISGNVAVIGAPFAERSDRCGFMSDRFGMGNAFIFERDHGVWREVAILGNPDCGWAFSGSSVTDGKRILATAHYINDPTGQHADSRAYSYERRHGIWTLQGALMAPACTNNFGLGLALAKGTLLATNGAVHVFRMNQLAAAPPRTCTP